MTILITGANGKLGRALVSRFAGSQPVRAAARALPMGLPQGVISFAIGDVDGESDWREALSGVDTIVHCAALTWVEPGDDEQAYFRVNTDGTEALSQQAAKAGVRRLVFISSLTVNGKHTQDRPFRHDDVPNPKSAYSRSKLAAEEVLRAVSAETGLEVTIIRPPRIIWPELGGNLKQLAGLVRRGVPVPFGAVNDNARDNVSIENLLSLIETATHHPQAADETFLVSDDDPLSTRELIERLGRHVGRRAKLLSVPKGLLRAIVNAAPQRFRGRLTAAELSDELLGDLRVDIAHARYRLGWEPGPPVLG